MIAEKDKDLDYWKKNAEEDYMQVPISVLRYISKLEEVVKNCSIPIVVGQSEQLKAEVFTLANKLAISGEGDAAVAMHRIHNRL